MVELQLAVAWELLVDGWTYQSSQQKQVVAGEALLKPQLIKGTAVRVTVAEAWLLLSREQV